MTSPRTAEIAARIAAVPCLVCGGTPTAYVRFYGRHGIAGTPSERWVDGPFCHECGVATFRTATAWLLGSGWFSAGRLISMPVYVIINASARLQVGRTAQSTSATAPSDARPLATGAPLVRRRGAYRALIPLAVVVAIACGIVLGLQAIGNRRAHTISVGECVQIGGVAPGDLGKYQVDVGSLHFVSCSGPHNGRIVKALDKQGDCPAEDATVQSAANSTNDAGNTGNENVATDQYCVAPA